MGIFDRLKKREKHEERETARGTTSGRESSRREPDFSGVRSGSGSTLGERSEATASERTAGAGGFTGGKAGSAAAPRTYEVQSGDSLSKIAQRFYGNGNLWPRIHEANKDQIRDPDLIHPGQKLIIP